MLVNVCFLLLGFAFLLKSAEMLVDGAEALAKKLKISELVIGLTIVAFGTSAPEIFINLIANFRGQADLGVGNIIGANIANVLLVAGLAALIFPIRIKTASLKREVPLGLVAIALIIFLANDFFLYQLEKLSLGRLDGLILLGLFAVFIYYTIGLSLSKAGAKTKTPDILPANFHHPIVHVVLGAIGLTIGGELTVRGATDIALLWGLAPTLIGLTIVAIGTTLPELFASITAAIKKDADLALGNVIGSLVFNLTFILGLNAFLKPMAFNLGLNQDLLIAFFATALLLYFALNGKKERFITRWEGGLLFSAYLIYLIFSFTR